MDDIIGCWEGPVIHRVCVAEDLSDTFVWPTHLSVGQVQMHTRKVFYHVSQFRPAVLGEVAWFQLERGCLSLTFQTSSSCDSSLSCDGLYYPITGISVQHMAQVHCSL